MQLKQHNSEPWSEAHIDNGKKKSPILIAQLGQALDGQIATATGQSKYINGQAGLEHLHHLRAWADVIVVGVGTVVADDPMLNVRLATGPDPHRVVIDPRGRTPLNSKMLSHGDVRKVILTGPDATLLNRPAGLPPDVDVVALAQADGSLEPARIVQWLDEQGWSKVLVEGGAVTVTRFLEAQCLDYLHIIVAPLLLGVGTPGLRLAAADSLEQARRFEARSYPLQNEQLIVCKF